MGRKRDPDDPARRGPVAYGTSHHLSDQLEAAGGCDWPVWAVEVLERTAPSGAYGAVVAWADAPAGGRYPAARRACDSGWHVWAHKALERAEAELASCGTAGLTGDLARLVRRAQAGPDSSAAAAG